MAQNVQMQSIERTNKHLSAQLQTVVKHKHQLEKRVTELEGRVNKLEVKQPTASKPVSVHPSSKQPTTYLTGTVKPTGAEFTMTGFDRRVQEGR